MKQLLRLNLIALFFFILLNIYTSGVTQAETFQAISKSVALNPNSSRSIILFATGSLLPIIDFSINNYPLNGNLTLNGNIAYYTPVNDFSGNDSFTYTARNIKESSEPGVISVTVGSFANMDSNFIRIHWFLNGEYKTVIPNGYAGKIFSLHSWWGNHGLKVDLNNDQLIDFANDDSGWSSCNENSDSCIDAQGDRNLMFTDVFSLQNYHLWYQYWEDPTHGKVNCWIDAGDKCKYAPSGAGATFFIENDNNFKCQNNIWQLNGEGVGDNDIYCIQFDTCGDGYLSVYEECDDGNRDNGDGCNFNCEVEQVELAKQVQEILLIEGWNLISYSINTIFYDSDSPPVVPALSNASYEQVNSLGDVFESIDGKFSIINNYDANGTQTFDTNALPIFNTLHYLAPGYGYYIKMAEAATLSLTGVYVNPSDELLLQKGWNLVGCWHENLQYDSLNPPTIPLSNNIISSPVSSVSDIFSTIIGKYSVIIKYDINGAGVFDPLLPEYLNTLDYVSPGYGYWIKMKDSAYLHY